MCKVLFTTDKNLHMADSLLTSSNSFSPLSFLFQSIFLAKFFVLGNFLKDQHLPNNERAYEAQ